MATLGFAEPYAFLKMFHHREHGRFFSQIIRLQKIVVGIPAMTIMMIMITTDRIFATSVHTLGTLKSKFLKKLDCLNFIWTIF